MHSDANIVAGHEKRLSRHRHRHLHLNYYWLDAAILHSKPELSSALPAISRIRDEAALTLIYY